MINSSKSFALLLLASGLIAACAAKPPNVQPIAPTSDVTQEIEATQKMLDQAKNDNLEILAPRSFERAQVSLNEAREKALDGKSNEKVLKNVADSRAWLRVAEDKGAVTRAAAKDLSAARTGAIRANAPNLFQKEFLNLDDSARDLSAAAEKGDTSVANREGELLAKRYHELEGKSLTKNFLTEAQENLKAAKKANGDKSAPQSYSKAEAKISNTQGLIDKDPANIDAIAKSAKDATEESKFLLGVVEKTKAGNSEDLVLQGEQQRRELAGMAVGLEATQAELEKSKSEAAKRQAAEKTAQQLRAQLRPQEADVSVEGNAVKVRLKGVQFGANKTTLNKKSTSLLDKVDQVLGTVGVSQVTVEGHTDSVGDEQVNQEISQKRAEAVQNFMASSGKLVPDKVKAVGRGEEAPISDNKTPRGRAENRRIDLVIEPGVGSRVE
jgi:OOP family OmpA-OmpF porin